MVGPGFGSTSLDLINSIFTRNGLTAASRSITITSTVTRCGVEEAVFWCLIVTENECSSSWNSMMEA